MLNSTRLVCIFAKTSAKAPAKPFRHAYPIFTSRSFASSSIMSINTKLLPVEKEDMARVNDLIFDVFGTDEVYMDSCFPDHESPEGRDEARRRYEEQTFGPGAKQYRHMKVIDADSGDIIAQGRWQLSGKVFGVPEPPQPGANGGADIGHASWKTEEEKVHAHAMWAAWTADRRQAFAEADGPVMSLDILTVDKTRQRTGAGSLLVGEGVKEADRVGAECVVEASPPGMGLYQKFGFQFVKHVVFDLPGTPLPPQFKDRPYQQAYWMVRPAKGREYTSFSNGIRK